MRREDVLDQSDRSASGCDERGAASGGGLVREEDAVPGRGEGRLRDASVAGSQTRELPLMSAVGMDREDVRRLVDRRVDEEVVCCEP